MDGMLIDSMLIDSMLLDTKVLQQKLQLILVNVIDWLTSPQFYAQCALILGAMLMAYSIGRALVARSPLLKSPPQHDSPLGFRRWIYQCRRLIVPLFMVFFLAIAVSVSESLLKQSWLVRIAQGLAVLFMFYSLISQFIISPLLGTFFKWVVMPIAMLHVFNVLDSLIEYLDKVSVNLGNIEFSAYGVLRTLFFGLILFWLGRLSNNVGQQFIRKQEDIDIGTREVFAKLFEILLLLTIFFILLQIMGINLTTLAVFGGAIGVGLGFGLQAIASNFISGIILLLDRSLTVGDYIELEDGRTGTIRDLRMRSATLETFDGKDIVVPNETFITSSFTNWTHKDTKQRYSLEFQVSYKTDLHRLFPLLKQAIAAHPQVLSGDQFSQEIQPDAEISGFGDSGVDILVEYWIEGIDDGKSRVGADLLLIIWDVLKQHVVDIPYPQREVRILNDT
ncbi:MAG: mechanosensitive ion channel domain-containing protein [Pseudomonadota bacterium]